MTFYAPRNIGPADQVLFDADGNAVGIQAAGSSSPPVLGFNPTKHAAIDSLVSGERNRKYPLEQHGEIEEALTFATVAMTSGSPVLAVTGYTFGASDVGKTVGVLGAGVVSADFEALANDGVLVGTILSVSGGNATLSVNATNTVSGASCVFGWPIDTALTAAIAACRADYAVDGVVGYIDFPAG